jgi:hypothetical protein
LHFRFAITTTEITTMDLPDKATRRKTPDEPVVISKFWKNRRRN